MSILSRRGLSMVRYILLDFDVVFVCLLFVFWVGGRRGLFIFLFVVGCFLLLFFVLFFCLFFVLYFGGIK